MFLLWGKTIIDNWSYFIKVGWIVVSSKDSRRNWRVIQRNPWRNELKGTANKQLLFLMIYESPSRSSIGCQKCSTIGFGSIKSYSNRPYSRYPPSLHTLKDWWDKGNVTWFLGEGGTNNKICRYKKSRSSLFILDNRKWRTYYLKHYNEVIGYSGDRTRCPHSELYFLQD